MLLSIYYKDNVFLCYDFSQSKFFFPVVFDTHPLKWLCVVFSCIKSSSRDGEPWDIPG